MMANLPGSFSLSLDYICSGFSQFIQALFVTWGPLISRNFSFNCSFFSKSALPHHNLQNDSITDSSYEFCYLEAVKYRRTVYGITDSISVSDYRIIEIVNQVIQSLPSSWSMQSTRILVTLGKKHKRFWGAVMDAAKPFILGQKGEEDWQRNEERFRSFRNAYGTVCVFSTCF